MSQKKHIRQATTVDASRNSRTIVGGAVSYAPQPTPKPSTTSRTGRRQSDIRGAVIQERALVHIHWRSPLEVSTGRTTGDQTMLEGEAD